MLVRLGFTFHPHRAHIVRGLLEENGLTAAVWHDHVAHIYGPGVFGCAVMVDDDDMDEVRAIMTASFNRILDSDESDKPEPGKNLFPDFFSLFIAGTPL